MLGVAAELLLAAFLAGTALAKLADPASSRAALATFGIDDPTLRWVAWAVLIAAELGLAVGVGAGSDVAALGAAAVMAIFAATLGGAMLRGRAGAPCACLGARSTVGGAAIARNLLLACAFAALPLLPSGELSTDQWLTLLPAAVGGTKPVRLTPGAPWWDESSTVCVSFSSHPGLGGGCSRNLRESARSRASEGSRSVRAR